MMHVVLLYLVFHYTLKKHVLILHLKGFSKVIDQLNTKSNNYRTIKTFFAIHPQDRRYDRAIRSSLYLGLTIYESKKCARCCYFHFLNKKEVSYLFSSSSNVCYSQ